MQKINLIVLFLAFIIIACEKTEESYVKNILAYEQEGNLALALAEAIELREEKTSLSADFFLGRINRKLGNFDIAEKELSRVRSGDLDFSFLIPPGARSVLGSSSKTIIFTSTSVTVELALLYIQTERYAKAEVELSDEINSPFKDSSLDGILFYLRGMARIRMGLTQKGCEDIEKAASLVKDDDMYGKAVSEFKANCTEK